MARYLSKLSRTSNIVPLHGIASWWAFAAFILGLTFFAQVIVGATLIARAG